MMVARLMQFSSSRMLPGQVGLDGAHRVFAQRQQLRGLLVREAAHKGMGQQGRVADAVAQRRNVDDDLGQAVIQVFAEALSLVNAFRSWCVAQTMRTSTGIS
jgi:hypothetical protein